MSALAALCFGLLSLILSSIAAPLRTTPPGFYLINLDEEANCRGDGYADQATRGFKIDQTLEDCAALCLADLDCTSFDIGTSAELDDDVYKCTNYYHFDVYSQPSNQRNGYGNKGCYMRVTEPGYQVISDGSVNQGCAVSSSFQSTEVGVIPPFWCAVYCTVDRYCFGYEVGVNTDSTANQAACVLYSDQSRVYPLLTRNDNERTACLSKVTVPGFVLVDPSLRISKCGGGSAAQTATRSSYSDCSARCLADSGCTAFSFIPYSLTCSLFTHSGVTAELSWESGGCWKRLAYEGFSLVDDNTDAACRGANGDIPGSALGIGYVYFDECAATCAAQSLCRAFDIARLNYHKAEENQFDCYLYLSSNSLSVVDDSSVDNSYGCYTRDNNAGAFGESHAGNESSKAASTVTMVVIVAGLVLVCVVVSLSLLLLIKRRRLSKKTEARMEECEDESADESVHYAEAPVNTTQEDKNMVSDTSDTKC